MPRTGKANPINSSILSAETKIQLVPYGEDPLQLLASLLLKQHQDSLPDLSRQIVLFSHTGVVPRFRQILRQQAALAGHSALLVPYCGTLATWTRQFSDSNKRPLGETAREIVLLELLNNFPEWRGHYNAWPLVDSLLALFDELTRHQCEFSADSEVFIRRLRGHLNADEILTYEDEARLVHAIWTAWRKRLHKDDRQDQAMQIMDGLHRSPQSLSIDAQIYVAGFLDFSRAEIEWFKSLQARGQLTLLLQGRVKPTTDSQENLIQNLLKTLNVMATVSDVNDPYTAFLENAYACNETALQERARRQKMQVPLSPAHGRLTIHEATDAEFEARAIDLQVRRWLLQGHRDIGIVTHDRKLARRVRALLERGNVTLQDAGGWALSTTSAATALVRWMECVEQNFSHKPLFDLLKSPFLSLGFKREELSRIVPAFEQIIVRAYNIASGLDNYRFGLERAKNILNERFDANTTDSLVLLLKRLEDAAEPLMALSHERMQSSLIFLEALEDSLKKLGLTQGFQNDDAGRELLAVLTEMRAASAHGNLRLSWSGFHQWLRRNMEQHHFHPPAKGGGVELMGLADSRLYRFDALIIAGAVREHLPGNIDTPPYFNDNVRIELGLPSLARRYAEAHDDFCRLLEAAPVVMVSLSREHQGEKLVPSPWIERLRSFHELAYQNRLDDPELEWLVRQADTLIVDRDTPLPTPLSRPAMRLPVALLPSTFSATDYQRLMDCPYQFICVNGLGLSAEKQIREEIEKVDFGTYVHRILQAFHAGLPGLPGPWRGVVNEQNLVEAEQLLRKISETVFASDLRKRFFTRGWFYRWEACIPSYLEWEVKRSARWQIKATELKKTRDYQIQNLRLSITGRIDRLDSGPQGLRLVDYKTGAIPTRDQVLQGEKIQLPFYALLLEEEKIAEALFLSIQDGEVTEKTVLDGDKIAPLSAAIQNRLLQLKRLLDEATPMTAWGDSETCDRCDMESLCRREMWSELNATESLDVK